MQPVVAVADTARAALVIYSSKTFAGEASLQKGTSGKKQLCQQKRQEDGETGPETGGPGVKAFFTLGYTGTVNHVTWRRGFGDPCPPPFKSHLPQ